MDYLIYSIEDDKDIAQIINKTLSKQGYEVKTFYDGKSFFEAFKEKKPDMILLDMMLPDYSGSDILKMVRSDEENDEIEIIIISANHMVMDKVDGLDLGADDYIEKPFDLLELMSRVQAKFRRHRKKDKYVIDDVTFDLSNKELKINGQNVDLTVKEYDIIRLLFQNIGNIVSREAIYKSVWNVDGSFESRTIDMHVKAIRKKIDPYDYIIKTIYGMGYKI